jgi:membrane protein YqaA with SNARE-associated domain
MNMPASQTPQIAVPGLKHGAAPPSWLTHFGVLGIFLVSAVDSSIVPLVVPGSTDLLLLWLVAQGGDPWLLAAGAVAGSLLGGYSTWQIGRKGGEAALRRHVPARHLGRITRWIERHPVLAVFLPAILPPPIPLAPFVLGAGALGVARNRFLAVFGAARSLRYSFIAWLALFYGRRIVRIWSGSIERWTAPLLCIFAVLIMAGVCFGVWKLRRPHKINAADQFAPGARSRTASARKIFGSSDESESR